MNYKQNQTCRKLLFNHCRIIKVGVSGEKFPDVFFALIGGLSCLENQRTHRRQNGLAALRFEELCFIVRSPA